MKKVLLFMFLLSFMASSASAGLEIVVRRNVDEPFAWYADSKLTIVQSDLLEVRVLGNDLNGGVYLLGIGEGPGSLDASALLANPLVTAEVTDDAVKAAEIGLQNYFVTMTVNEPILYSVLVADLVIHCDGPGDIKFVAINDDTWEVEAVQVVHQIPEPATLALLSLGGVLLRKRKR